MRVVSNLLITLGGDSELITRSVITRVTVADSLRGGGGGGGGVGLGVTDCYLKNGQGHSLVWDASPGANDKISSNSSLTRTRTQNLRFEFPATFPGANFVPETGLVERGHSGTYVVALSQFLHHFYDFRGRLRWAKNSAPFGHL
jgi:hypothetical protein